jgi:GPH family glycoside/pentoside/hexuronide:cation symporter
MGLQGIWNAILNPLAGQLSDRTHTRWGRRVPYIAVASAPLGLVYWLVWRPVVDRSALPWYFAITVTLFDLFYVVTVLNWTSLFPDMYRTIEDRSKTQAWRESIGVVALMIGVSSPPILYARFGWSAMGLGFAIIGTAGFLVSILGARTAVATQDSTPRAAPLSVLTAFRQTATNGSFLSYLAMNFFIQFTFSLIPAALPFFAKYVMHMHGVDLSLLLASIFVVALAAMWPWSRYLARVGSHRAMQTTLVLLTLGVLPFWWLTHLAWALVAGVVLGLGLAGFLCLADVLIAEVIDADAKKNGQRREGSFYGINGFAIRFGVSLEALVVYTVFHFTGYHANAAGYAPPLVQWGLRFMIGGVPLLAYGIAAIGLRYFRAEESPRESSDLIRPVPS